MNRKFISKSFIRKRRALFMLLILTAIPIIGFFYFGKQWIMQPLEIGEQAPSIKVRTLEGREVLTSSILKKKSILIFFSPDCSHCQKEIDDLCLFYPILKNSLSIIAVSSSEMQKTKDFIDAHNIPFSVYLDDNDKAKVSFRVRPIPALFLINEKQQIVQYKAGEQKRDLLWPMLKRFAGLIKDTSLAKL